MGARRRRWPRRARPPGRQRDQPGTKEPTKKKPPRPEGAGRGDLSADQGQRGAETLAREVRIRRGTSRLFPDLRLVCCRCLGFGPCNVAIQGQKLTLELQIGNMSVKFAQSRHFACQYSPARGKLLQVLGSVEPKTLVHNRRFLPLDQKRRFASPPVRRLLTAGGSTRDRPPSGQGGAMAKTAGPRPEAGLILSA